MRIFLKFYLFFICQNKDQKNKMSHFQDENIFQILFIFLYVENNRLKIK